LLPTVRRTWGGETPLLRHHYLRDKVPAISALTVSPRRHRCGPYAHFHCDNITQGEVALFLRLLLRHLAGPIIVLWDGSSSREVTVKKHLNEIFHEVGVRDRVELALYAIKLGLISARERVA